MRDLLRSNESQTYIRYLVVTSYVDQLTSNQLRLKLRDPKTRAAIRNDTNQQHANQENVRPPLHHGNPPNDLRGAARAPRQRNRNRNRKALGPSTPSPRRLQRRGRVPPRPRPLGLEPSILQVSRQTHAEVSFALYARNRFDRRSHLAKLATRLSWRTRAVPRRGAQRAARRRVRARHRAAQRRPAPPPLSIVFPSLQSSHFQGRTAGGRTKHSAMLNLVSAQYPNLERVGLCMFTHLNRYSTKKKDLAFVDTQATVDAAVENCRSLLRGILHQCPFI